MESMQTIEITWLRHAVFVVATLLILKVTASVVIEYRRYLPPDFESDFLLGRQAYFWNGYHWAFYVHLVSGPASLVLGTVLLNERLRHQAPLWHKRLGRWHGLVVLLLLVPSGLWMARYANSGGAAGLGLGVLAILTAACVALGWRAAIRRNFAGHRLWMLRTYILLCSAVVIRLIGGLAIVVSFDAPWLYPLSVWGSWLVPLAIFEMLRLLQVPRRTVRRLMVES
jgi:hypothetical protein